MTTKKEIDRFVRRNSASGVIAKVHTGGRIKIGTAIEILALISTRTSYKAHLAIEVNTGPMLKTIDNEADAQETLSRLRAAPEKTTP